MAQNNNVWVVGFHPAICNGNEQSNFHPSQAIMMAWHGMALQAFLRYILHGIPNFLCVLQENATKYMLENALTLNL